MPDKPDCGSRANEEQFEGPGELFEPLKKFREISTFGKTLAAVLKGEPLYDFDKQRLQKEGYLGPWQFNALQSTLSGLPAVIIPFCARLFGVSGGEGDDKLNEILQSFAVPFVLMLTAYVVGRASLWKRDATLAARRRAGRIFLYLDGAYGLYPQLAACGVYTLFFLFPNVDFIRYMIYAVSGQQLVIYMKTIPDRLFTELGYLSVTEVSGSGAPITLFASQSKPQETLAPRSVPPKWKFRLCVLFVIPAIAITVSAAIYFVSMAIHSVSSA